MIERRTWFQFDSINSVLFISVNFDPADTAKVQREMCSALKARKEALEDILRKRTEELKLLCIKEGVSYRLFYDTDKFMVSDLW